MSGTTSIFTSGNLVISIYGDGAGTGNYTDNQAAPVVLEQVTTTGAVVSSLTLPQTTTTNSSGVTEYAFSGEYGSSSEGSLSLSADGQSLVIAGYAVNAATYNTGGAAVYGNAALAQSTSVKGGTYTPVARAIADVSATGVIDTSTALYNIANTNNPRSVATVNGTSFYISGQGVKGDSTQGVFLATDGASTATAIDTSTDTRTVEIYNGELYVSRDSKQGTNGTSNIADYGTTLPTSATAPIILPGISQTDTLTAAQENTVNASAVGTAVHLSPENYFFANATTLYVADGGNPKEGGLGDGGLQKWVYNGTTWTLAYTLSAGLNLVPDTASSGTTGLIGLTGVVVGNTVQLYATNSTIGDLDQTYLYGITDTLNATTGNGETFSVLDTAAADTNIRGVAFAPTVASAPCYCPGTLILTDRGDVPVEELAIGDRVITFDGKAEPIVWIGRRSFGGRFLAGRRDLLPVRIAAGALGMNLPIRDLRVSPLHAMYLDGVLVPARELVNGLTITQDHGCRTVEYIHIELAMHDVIWAEGAPSETFVDDDSRAMFHNAAEHARLYPDAIREEAIYCAPRVTDGYALEAIRQRLAAFASVASRAA